MTYKLLVAATFALGLGTAIAVAQTDTVQPEAGAAPDVTTDTHLPSGWDGAIGDAFFSDAELGTLRSQEEVQANWETLTDEQQAQVRSHCDTIDTAATDTLEAPAAGDTTTGAAETEDDVDRKSHV